MEGGVGGERGEIYANVARFARNGKRVSWATLGSGAEDGFAALWPSPSPPPQLPQLVPRNSLLPSQLLTNRTIRTCQI